MTLGFYLGLASLATAPNTNVKLANKLSFLNPEAGFTNEQHMLTVTDWIVHIQSIRQSLFIALFSNKAIQSAELNIIHYSSILTYSNLVMCCAVKGKTTT